MSSDDPALRLFVHGPLGPEGPNAHALEAIGGTWERASIRGRLETPSPSAEEGFRVLRLDEGGEEIEGHVFSSSQLAAHWDELDALVGPEYQRVPVRVTRETGLELEAEAY
ncbi:MAG: gamma-glutamylcyclotransferase family protein, partial [Myxococcota bacterium]